VTEQAAARRAAEAGITITRVFDAPRHLVWTEFTEPTCFANWFGGPDTEVPLSTVSIDLRPGGAWTATTLSYGPDRRDIRWDGVYLEITEPKRLAFTIRGIQRDRTPDEVTVILTDLCDGRTEMLFRQQGRRTTQQYELAREQWSVEFDYIAEHMAARELGAETGSRSAR
jgi:uncharacterized protein YndB with AHSA1/START domain